MRNRGNSNIGITILVLLLLTPFLFFAPPACAGDGSWGFGADLHAVDVVVTSKHVDITGSKDSTSTHYMVGTDKGMFAVDNGFILGMWNADDIYGKLEQGKRYRITVQGDTTASWWTQTYPYVLSVQPLE